MKKIALITAALLLGSSAVWGKVAAKAPTTAPATAPARVRSLSVLMRQANQHEAAGDYALAVKSARAAMAMAHGGGAAKVPLVLQLRKQLRRLARRQGSMRRLATLNAALTARPGDLATRERIIKLCIVELDNPLKATAFVNEDTDQILQTYVPMAAKKVDEIVAEASCRALAEWYESNLKTLRGFGRVAMLRRAAAYYGRFLQLHKTADAESAKALEKYKDVARQLADLGESPDLNSN